MVTNEDREAAAAIVYAENKDGLNWASAKGMRDHISGGHWDEHRAVQAFAAHREAAMIEGARMALDAADRELALTCLANIEAPSEWIDGFEHAGRRVRSLDPAAIVKEEQ